MGISFGDYVPKVREKREEKVKDVATDFVVYPRIWLNNMYKCNYGFDWNRNFDDKLNIEAVRQNDLLNNCTKGKDAFQKYYETGKSTVNAKDYYAPYLIMFENHGEKTGREVILNLYIHFEDSSKLKNSFVKAECDNSLFEVGFTTNGKTIASDTFNLDKKYFKDEYYNTGRKYREENGKLKSDEDTAYEPELNGDILELSNVMVKCKKAIDKEEKIIFKDNKGNIVGSLIVKPNNTALLSNRTMCFVKIKRKNFAEKDLGTIKSKLLATQILEFNGKERTYLNENEAITNIVKESNTCCFSKLLVNFSNSFELDEIEVDDDKLKSEGIISDEKVLLPSKYLSYMQNQYFLNKKYDYDTIKSKMFFFISPINDKKSDRMAFAMYEDVNIFASILYNTQPYTLTHEIAHDFGLKHVFESNDNDDDINKKEKYVSALENNQKIRKSDINNDNNDLKIRRKNQYPFPYTFYEGSVLKTKEINDSKEWQSEIDKMELEYKNNAVLLEKQKKLVVFLKAIDTYHEIYFNQASTENLMDYGKPYLTFYYQHEIIQKLNDEFKHI
jgi:hypothetical protein